jgi:hypothetical protein
MTLVQDVANYKELIEAQSKETRIELTCPYTIRSLSGEKSARCILKVGHTGYHSIGVPQLTFTSPNGSTVRVDYTVTL